MGLYEQVDYDFSGPLQPQDLFGREYVTMGGVIDHHLTTTVQSHTKMPKRPVVTTNNGLFLVLAVNVQDQQNSRFNVCLRRPAVVLRPGRPEVRILPVALKKRIAMYFCNALFVLMLFGFRIILVAYHPPRPCIALLPAVHFSVDLQWYT